jgi:hypothetical protein
VCNRDFWEGPVQRRRVKKERQSTKYIKRHQEKYKYKIFSFRRREAVLHTFHSPVAKTNRNYTLPHSLSLSLSLSRSLAISHRAEGNPISLLPDSETPFLFRFSLCLFRCLFLFFTVRKLLFGLVCLCETHCFWLRID